MRSQITGGSIYRRFKRLQLHISNPRARDVAWHWPRVADDCYVQRKTVAAESIDQLYKAFLVFFQPRGGMRGLFHRASITE